MLHRHQEVSFQLQDLRTSTESVGFSCISSSPLKPHSEDPGSVPFSGKLCSFSCKPVRNRILISKERNITVSGDLSGLLMDNFVRRNLTQRVQVLLLKASKRDLIGCSVDS